MVGISEVLSESDEDLLNIYLETFKYIDELPVDTAKNCTLQNCQKHENSQGGRMV